jgi:hypothetical protein
MAESTDWVRVRGMGRERFAGYLEEYLTTNGYHVDRTESADPAETRVAARLEKMNPAIPASAASLSFRLTPTSGGAAVVWETPTEVPAADRPRLERMVREFVAHLERAVSTESHATAKVLPPPHPRLPWSAPFSAESPGQAL